MMANLYGNFANVVQAITVYESREALHVIGSDQAEKIFRLLEISRNDRKGLVIHDDQKTYTIEEIRTYLNKQKQDEKYKTKSSKPACRKVASGYSIAGFVRFTEGYYMILVVRRKNVAIIGTHVIYKVEDTAMIYIPNDKISRPDEHKYAKLFENVDFSNNFYFSFTYDLTHTLQYNQTRIQKPVNLSESPSEPNYVEARQHPLEQFVWNRYLLQPVKGKVHDDWIIYLVHGFLSQLDMIVFGRHIYITLIARRSNQYAGTRFLKRGCNPKGHVANEVETEQIVHDASQTSLDGGAFTSFVQLRGSIPLYWSQDLTNAMSKPPISHPYGEISSKHFRQLFRRYGAPIIILNLVKRREKRKHESVLWDELAQSIEYLNQFLQNDHKIRYVAFDMARSNKKKESKVLDHLDDLSERCIEKTGFYVANCVGQEDRKQTGVIRTNCVDCLDRTNTAQLAVGKHALGHQLHALGVTPTTELLFDTDCVTMLEGLYEDQGDTISLQYGGSNLVHRVQSYRKTDTMTSHSDILQTIARYYKNSFTDTEKQQAFNVFLGVYRPFDESVALWDLPNDYYLHSAETNVKVNYCEWVEPKVRECLPRPYNEVYKEYHLVKRRYPTSPMSDFGSVYRVKELTAFDRLFCLKVLPNSIQSFMPRSVNIDTYMYATNPFDVRKTDRWSHFLNYSSHAFRRKQPLDDIEGQYTISSSSYTDLSTRELGNSVFHTGSITEDPDSSSSEESDIECKLTSDEEEEQNGKVQPTHTPIGFNDLLDDPYRMYGVDLHYTCRATTKLYKHYEKFYDQLYSSDVASTQMHLPSRVDIGKPTPQIKVLCKSIFPFGSEIKVIPPTVKKETKLFYKRVVTVGRHGATNILPTNRSVYHKYVQQLHQ